jgi:nitrogen fixation-related uncharacterized protein
MRILFLLIPMALGVIGVALWAFLVGGAERTV